MFCVFKTIFIWVGLLIVSINLIGWIMRGLLWRPPQIDAPTDRVREVLLKESKKMTSANIFMTLLVFAVALGYIFILYHFGNIFLMIAGVLLMLFRLPDLIWEIRTGSRISRTNAPQGFIHTASFLLMFFTLPLVWYSICVAH
jgi:hypothetical protein